MDKNLVNNKLIFTFLNFSEHVVLIWQGFKPG